MKKVIKPENIRIELHSCSAYFASKGQSEVDRSEMWVELIQDGIISSACLWSSQAVEFFEDKLYLPCHDPLLFDCSDLKEDLDTVILDNGGLFKLKPYHSISDVSLFGYLCRDSHSNDATSIIKYLKSMTEGRDFWLSGAIGDIKSEYDDVGDVANAILTDSEAIKNPWSCIEYTQINAGNTNRIALFKFARNYCRKIHELMLETIANNYGYGESNIDALENLVKVDKSRTMCLLPFGEGQERIEASRYVFPNENPCKIYLYELLAAIRKKIQ